MTDILALLLAAAAEGHNEVRLRRQVIERLVALRPHLPPAPAVPERVHARLARPERLGILRIDGVVTALAEAIGPEDGGLWDDLVALNLVAARLGATICTMRLGRHVIAALKPNSSAKDSWLTDG